MKTNILLHLYKKYDELFFNGANFWIDGISTIFTIVNIYIGLTVFYSYAAPYNEGVEFFNVYEYPTNLGKWFLIGWAIMPNWFILIRDKANVFTLELYYHPVTAFFCISIAFTFHILFAYTVSNDYYTMP